MCEEIPPNFRAGAVGPGQTSEVWRLLDWALRNQGRPLTTVNAGPNHLTPMNGVKGRRHSRAAFDAPIDKAHASPNASGMTSLPVTQARFKLYQLLDQAADSHEPIQITGKRSNAVLVPEDDWRSMQETLDLISIPGMRDSIRKGMAEPLDKASTKPGW